MSRFDHWMIVANAGSGKTYCLITRLARLLLSGVEPRAIAALTFTRKAAGEFLEQLFLRFAAAASDPARCALLAEETGVHPLTQQACLDVLKRLVRQSGQLGMGTIDALLVRIAKAFPFEAGLGGNFEIADAAALAAARDETLAALLRRRVDSGTFLDIVRLQARARGERKVFEALARVAANLLGSYAATPPGVAWGDPATIWPSGNPALDLARPVTEAAEAFRKAVEETHPDLDAEACEKLGHLLDRVASLQVGDVWDGEVSKFFSSKLVSPAVSGSLRIGRKKTGWVRLDPAVVEARRALATAMTRIAIETVLVRSRALHAFLQEFDDLYERTARRAGLLDFADVAALLAGVASTPAWRAAVGYRLDARFRHWLLDEFQDTSRLQWRVLAPLVEEALQDDSGERTFFYVGDTKQAIYSWRGGDHRLFFEVAGYYGKDGRIQHRPLAESYRSAPPILEAVNTIFGDAEAVAAGFGLEQSAKEEWARAWSPHTASQPTRKMDGVFEWKTVPDDEDVDPRDAAILDLLGAMKPWERGLSCAVLKPTNDGLAALASLLAQHRIPVSVEGRTNPCTDSPCGSALVLALRCLISPRDTLAAALLEGTPLGAAICAGRWREEALETLAASGFESLVRAWTERPGSSDPVAAAAFHKAAAAFDATRKPASGLPEFLDFIEAREELQGERRGVVRLLTIHGAKGLTFDVCITAGIDGVGSKHGSDTIHLGPSAASPRWGVVLPRKDVAEQDGVLAAALASRDDEDRFGKVCAAYVALTRARFGCYVITTHQKETSTARHLGTLLANTLDQRVFGNPQWFEKHSATPGLASPAPHPKLPPPRHTLPAPQTPSVSAAPFHAAHANLGAEIHAALATIEWSPPTLPPLSTEATRRLEAFLQTPTAHAIFTPRTGTTVRREAPFELETNGTWISGTFDRIHIQQGSAVVYEFKTSQPDPDRYTGQTTAYQAAAAALLGLDPAQVRVEVVWI